MQLGAQQQLGQQSHMHHRSLIKPSGPSPQQLARQTVLVRAVKSHKSLKRAGIGQRLVHEVLCIELQKDGSDTWRLEPVIELLKQGGLGIIPTDSLPAVVCDLSNKVAALKLYNAMDLAPKKQLSILVGGFNDISTYTTGFPIPTQPGEPDWFGVARRLLPGPYTIILPASKNLPSQVVDFKKGKTQKRKSVGVRYPDNPIVQALIAAVGGPLLSHSVHVPSIELSEDEYLVPDTGALMDMYGSRGLDFIVEVGQRKTRPTSVIDMSGAVPEVVRAGKGDVSMFEN